MSSKATETGNTGSDREWYTDPEARAEKQRRDYLRNALKGAMESAGKMAGGEDEETESATNKFLRETCVPTILGMYVSRPSAICADGYRVSIQASSEPIVHCWPHEDTDRYTHVMLISPSCEDAELVPYRSDPEVHGGFYFFVPVRVMDKVLEKHGGIVGPADTVLACPKRDS